ncbi:MAG: lipocalin-like domain-containing protein [Flavobacteriia bacterium]|nr:lipocalin-like domain-containing protein [Flavobacteriia bacterium]
MKRVTVLLTLALLGCSQPEAPSNNLHGLWELVAMEVADTLGSLAPYRGGMQGYLLYSAEGHVALHLSDDGFQDSKEEFRNFTDTLSIDKLKYLTKSYHYVGNFSIEEWNEMDGVVKGKVQHMKLAHSNPNEWNDSSVRLFELKGDTLRMRPEEAANSSLRLVWYRHN